MCPTISLLAKFKTVPLLSFEMAQRRFELVALGATEVALGMVGMDTAAGTEDTAGAAGVGAEVEVGPAGADAATSARAGAAADAAAWSIG